MCCENEFHHTWQEAKKKKTQHKSDTVSPAETKKHIVGDNPFYLWRLKDQPSVFA